MNYKSTCRKTITVVRHASRQSRRHASTSAAEELERARTYCLNLVRSYDSPAYTLQTFIPPSSRDAYLALRAFNIDVSRVADATSNATVGSMRMQFWRDATARALDGTPPKEPVAVLLAAANNAIQDRTQGQVKLSKVWLHKMVAERQKYLSDAPYPTLAALETYAEGTYSSLLYLTLQALPVQSVAADHLASHIGKATGIAAVLRGLPLVAFPPPPNRHSNQAAFGGSGGDRHGAVALPLDVMAEVGVKEEDVLRQGANAPGLKDAVFAVATRANDHLITAREMLRNLQAGKDVGHGFEHEGEEGHDHSTVGAGQPRAHREMDDVERAFGVLMQALPTTMWLETLQKVDFDVFDAQLRRTDWRLPWRAFWTYRRRSL